MYSDEHFLPFITPAQGTMIESPDSVRFLLPYTSLFQSLSVSFSFVAALYSSSEKFFIAVTPRSQCSQSASSLPSGLSRLSVVHQGYSSFFSSVSHLSYYSGTLFPSESRSLSLSAPLPNGVFVGVLTSERPFSPQTNEKQLNLISEGVL